MTVEQLIDFLKQFDPETKVVVNGTDEPFVPKPEVIELFDDVLIVGTHYLFFHKQVETLLNQNQETV